MTASPETLPDVVLARLVAFAADALGLVPADQVPAPLRQVARFAPQRRARLGREQILAHVENDPVFRERIAVQVRARQPVAVAALDRDEPTPEAAALALLERPSGWQAFVDRVSEREREATEQSRAVAVDAQTAALRGKLEEAAAALADQRARAKEDQARLRAENTDLRRKLGETRAQLRRVRDEVAAAEASLEVSQAALASAAARADADVRRLRARVEELEAERGRSQRSGRSEREEATLRARLLLDTLIQSAQGLRSELALPVVEGEPADAVAARQAEAETRASSGHGSLAPEDPELLRQLLALPRVHVVVDGYNVTKTAWPDAALDAQRERLLRGVAPLVARSGASMTVVFDAAEADTRPVATAPRGVRVLFSAAGQIADDLIRELVAAEPPGRAVVVVTNDRAVLTDVRRRPGVHTAGALALARLIGRV